MNAWVPKATREYTDCAESLSNFLQRTHTTCGGAHAAFYLSSKREMEMDYTITYHFKESIKRREFINFITRFFQKNTRGTENLRLNAFTIEDQRDIVMSPGGIFAASKQRKRAWKNVPERIKELEARLRSHGIPFVYAIINADGEVIKGAHPDVAGDALFSSSEWKDWILDSLCNASIPDTYLAAARDAPPRRKRASNGPRQNLWSAFNGVLDEPYDDGPVGMDMGDGEELLRAGGSSWLRHNANNNPSVLPLKPIYGAEGRHIIMLPDVRLDRNGDPFLSGVPVAVSSVGILKS